MYRTRLLDFTTSHSRGRGGRLTGSGNLVKLVIGALARLIGVVWRSILGFLVGDSSVSRLIRNDNRLSILGVDLEVSQIRHPARHSGISRVGQVVVRRIGCGWSTAAGTGGRWTLCALTFDLLSRVGM